MNKLLSSAKAKFFLEVLFVTFIFFASITFAQTSDSGGGIKVNVLSTTQTSTTLEFVLTDYNQTIVKIGETDFVNYVVPEVYLLWKEDYRNYQFIVQVLLFRI